MRIDTEQIQKAIDLAEYYKDNVLSQYALIRYIYKEIKLMGIVSDPAKTCDMKEFNEREFNEIYTEQQIEDIKKLTKSPDLIKAIISAQIIFGECLNIEKYVSIEETEKGKTISKINADAIYKEYGNNIILNTLNNLEFFAMHFTHKTADEEVVYQSLHQTYIEIVQLLYYEIARKNKKDTDCYFSNVIELYSIWKKRAKEKDDEMNKVLRTVVHKGTTLNKWD